MELAPERLKVVGSRASKQYSHRHYGSLKNILGQSVKFNGTKHTQLVNVHVPYKIFRALQ